MATRQKHIKKVHTKRVNETKQKLDKILTGMFTFEYKLKNGSWNISKIARDSGLSRNTVYPNNSIRFKIESPKWL